MSATCYACRLLEGAEPLPGGQISATEHWVVEAFCYQARQHLG